MKDALKIVNEKSCSKYLQEEHIRATSKELTSYDS